MGYEQPVLIEIGEITELTNACVGSGPLDDVGKTADNPFSSLSPAFGDPSFCVP